jgi:hypothetical protein
MRPRRRAYNILRLSLHLQEVCPMRSARAIVILGLGLGLLASA